MFYSLLRERNIPVRTSHVPKLVSLSLANLLFHSPRWVPYSTTWHLTRRGYDRCKPMHLEFCQFTYCAPPALSALMFKALLSCCGNVLRPSMGHIGSSSGLATFRLSRHSFTPAASFHPTTTSGAHLSNLQPPDGYCHILQKPLELIKAVGSFGSRRSILAPKAS